ncbi:MAG: hypothetical protein V3V08_17450 [Nannocystaceae bacterium]
MAEPPRLLTQNPYPGLRPYTEAETHLFFGREKSTDEVLDRLRHSRFVAVLGRSGSGKSSLIAAGVVPMLDGTLPTEYGDTWRVAAMRPGSDPIGNLARALASVQFAEGSDEVAEHLRASANPGPHKQRELDLALMEATLRRSAGGVASVVERIGLGKRDNVLVLVDQFEELFRYSDHCADRREDDAAAFVRLLVEAVNTPKIGIYALVTMRSDFLGDCVRFPGLADTINRGQYLVPRLDRMQLHAAMTGPAKVAGVVLEPRLVKQMLADVQGQAEQLPLFQHALMRAMTAGATTAERARSATATIPWRAAFSARFATMPRRRGQKSRRAVHL